MEPTLRTPRPNLTMKISALSGSVSIPALADDVCPKCGACNATERQHHVLRVADERGLHFECGVCAASWREGDDSSRP
jgi:hypothetical protein